MSSEVEIVDPGPIVARELFEKSGVSIYSHALRLQASGREKRQAGIAELCLLLLSERVKKADYHKRHRDTEFIRNV